MNMVSYFGFRENGTARVVRLHHGKDPAADTDLDPRLDLHSHSPTGFEWGYAGSGPSQLALALLADFLGDDAKALNLYQLFKFAVVAQLSRPTWMLSEQDIADALKALEKEVST